MKKNFPGFYPLKSEHINELFTSATLIFDSDALLDLLMVQKEDASAFLNILKSDPIKDRLWLPYDVAWLYHLKMNNIILRQIDEINNALSHLTQCKSLIERPRSYPYLGVKTMSLLNRCIHRIESESGLQKQFLITSLGDSIIKNELDTIYTGKIGNSYASGELTIIYKEGESRYMQYTPPGYLSDFNENQRLYYHDYIVWKQLLKYSMDNHKDIILITGKVTNDWYYVVNGDVVSPRSELINEFMSLTDRQKYYSLSMHQFLEYCQHNLQLNIPRYETLLDQFRESIEYSSVGQSRSISNSGNI